MQNRFGDATGNKLDGGDLCPNDVLCIGDPR